MWADDPTPEDAASKAESPGGLGRGSRGHSPSLAAPLGHVLGRPAVLRRPAICTRSCAICGEATREPIAFRMVRPSLANGLAVTHPNLTTNDVICRKHLTEQQRYVEQLLERERGELSELERQVVESLAREETGG